MLIGNRNGWLGFDRARTMQMPNQGASWTPASLGSSLKGWWKADAGVRARTAADMVAANSEYLSILDNASLSTGDIPFWFAGWFYSDDVSGNDAWACKWNDGGGADDNEWLLRAETTSLLFYGMGSGGTPVTKTWGTAIAASTWYFVMIYHDPTNNLIGISVNGAAFQTAAFTLGFADSTAPFQIGRRGDAQDQYDGRAQMCAFGKSNTETFDNIRDALYNSGNGLALADVSAAQKTAWGAISAWPLTENSGTRADIWGSNTLTDNNTVTANDGKVDYAAATTDVLWKWIDQSAGALLPVQATQANKPTLVANVLNSRAVVRFDGTNDTLKVATGAISNQPLWGWMVVDDNDAGTRFYFDGGAASKVSLSHTTDLIVNAGAAVGAADTSGAPHLVTFIVNGASSDVRVDGASIATGDAGAQNMDSGIAIGADNAGASPLAGDIAEIGFAAGSPTAADLAGLKAYITARYGLTVA